MDIKKLNLLFKKYLSKLESKKGLGPGGKCFCPECGYEEEHETGEPCMDKECPECGEKLDRE